MHGDRYLFRRLIAIGLALLAFGFFASRDNPNTQSLFDRPRDLENFIDRAREFQLGVLKQVSSVLDPAFTPGRYSKWSVTKVVAELNLVKSLGWNVPQHRYP